MGSSSMVRYRGADLTAAADALLGALLFLVLARQPLNGTEMDGLVDVILHGVSS